MQDGYDPEMLGAVRLQVTSAFRSPQGGRPISPDGLMRYRNAGCDLIAERLEEIGIGPIARGRLLTCEPDIADAALRSIGVAQGSEVWIVAGYDPFGRCSAIRANGGDVILDPVMVSAIVADGPPPEDNILLQFEIANALLSQIDEAVTEVSMVDESGGDMLRQAVERHGSLAPGECYGFKEHPAAEGAFNVGNLEIIRVADYLQSTFETLPTEVTRMPMPDPADMAPGTSFGDDWD